MGLMATTCDFLRLQSREDTGACYFGCFKGVSNSVQELLHGIEAVLVLTVLLALR